MNEEIKEIIKEYQNFSDEEIEIISDIQTESSKSLAFLSIQFGLCTALIFTPYEKNTIIYPKLTGIYSFFKKIHLVVHKTRFPCFAFLTYILLSKVETLVDKQSKKVKEKIAPLDTPLGRNIRKV